MLLFFCAHCTFERSVFYNSSIIIFVLCRSAKKHAHGEVNEEMLRQTFSVFEPEQCLEMRNYKYRIEDFIIFWQMELVCFFLYSVLCWYILFILSFGRVTIDREMKKCQCYLIYDKAYGYVARLEWVRDSKKNSKEMYSFPCSLLTQFLFPIESTLNMLSNPLDCFEPCRLYSNKFHILFPFQ